MTRKLSFDSFSPAKDARKTVDYQGSRFSKKDIPILEEIVKEQSKGIPEARRIAAMFKDRKDADGRMHYNAWESDARGMEARVAEAKRAIAALMAAPDEQPMGLGRFK